MVLNKNEKSLAAHTKTPEARRLRNTGIESIVFQPFSLSVDKVLDFKCPKGNRGPILN